MSAFASGKQLKMFERGRVRQLRYLLEESVGLSSDELREASLKFRSSGNRQHTEEYQMAGQYGRERDDHGRYTSEDDDRSYRSRGSEGNGRRSTSNDRDQNGRYMREDDNGSYRSRGSEGGGRRSNGNDRDRDENGAS
jgi:hypothetical protein